MKLIILIISVVFTSTLTADTLNLRPDAHAPIGVMADHSHKKNEIMVSHRWMGMQMNSLYNGTSEVSESAVQSSYMMTPTTMQMNMHMIGAMWGYSNNLTVTAMINYRSNEMSMINQMNVSSDMNSEGFGDLKLGTIYTLSNSNNRHLLINSSLSVPIGSIEQKSDAGNHLPYGMQLGSGTYDVNLGITYTTFLNNYSYGGQINALVRLGRNTFDYSLGNQYKINTWAQKIWTKEISTSIKGSALFISDINGSDSSVSAMVAGMNPLYTIEQGSIRADIGIGINYFPKTNMLTGNRLAVEFNVPVFRYTNSINVVADSLLTFGIQRIL